MDSVGATCEIRLGSGTTQTIVQSASSRVSNAASAIILRNGPSLMKCMKPRAT